VAAWAAQGVLRPVIDRCYAMAEIAAAHAYVDTGRKRGSVVVRIAGAD
jgi:NADPH:quinone reductase-like Zn-dependent oxidoreductase